MTMEKLKGKIFEVANWINIVCIFVIISAIFSYHIQTYDPNFEVFLELLSELGRNFVIAVTGGDPLNPTDFVNQLLKKK